MLITSCLRLKRCETKSAMNEFTCHHDSLAHLPCSHCAALTLPRSFLSGEPLLRLPHAFWESLCVLPSCPLLARRDAKFVVDMEQELLFEVRPPSSAVSLCDARHRPLAARPPFLTPLLLLPLQMILAANYMDIKSLLDLCCAKVASMIKGKTTEEIRKTFNIKNDFTPGAQRTRGRGSLWPNLTCPPAPPLVPQRRRPRSARRTAGAKTPKVTAPDGVEN